MPLVKSRDNITTKSDLIGATVVMVSLSIIKLKYKLVNKQKQNQFFRQMMSSQKDKNSPAEEFVVFFCCEAGQLWKSNL